jgi:hypothetical protein
MPVMGALMLQPFPHSRVSPFSPVLEAYGGLPRIGCPTLSFAFSTAGLKGPYQAIALQDGGRLLSALSAMLGSSLIGPSLVARFLSYNTRTRRVIIGITA